jgi:hypothetical protein
MELVEETEVAAGGSSGSIGASNDALARLGELYPVVQHAMDWMTAQTSTGALAQLSELGMCVIMPRRKGGRRFTKPSTGLLHYRPSLTRPGSLDDYEHLLIWLGRAHTGEFTSGPFVMSHPVNNEPMTLEDAELAGLSADMTGAISPRKRPVLSAAQVRSH